MRLEGRSDRHRVSVSRHLAGKETGPPIFAPTNSHLRLYLRVYALLFHIRLRNPCHPTDALPAIPALECTILFSPSGAPSGVDDVDVRDRSPEDHTRATRGPLLDFEIDAAS